ncbi:MAG: sodium:proton antiporter, partial [Phycisphaerales bacterium]|nr:sodium:proton antiporter [Phycisphaerales bacterium]
MSLVIGLALGWGFSLVLKPDYHDPSGEKTAGHVDDDTEGDPHGGFAIAGVGDFDGPLVHDDTTHDDPTHDDTTPDDATDPAHVDGAHDEHPSGDAGHEDVGHGETDHGGHESHYNDEAKPRINLLLVAPFALLLLSIALMPFINEHFWHDHFPDFAFLLGGTMISYYLVAFGGEEYAHGLTYGQYQMKHVALEYYAFIALIGGLFVASGGILVDVRGRAGTLANVALLAFGAVFANIVGTTGASVLLIRPFMRMNKGRLRPIHVVMFIFIVSNCGGCLTPIGDPPLYLGFLKGVPFEWTIMHLWPMWLACIAMLLTVFAVIDKTIGPAPDASPADDRMSVRVKGMSGIAALGLIILGV